MTSTSFNTGYSLNRNSSKIIISNTTTQTTIKMPSVYNYRHVELDKVGRGKRVIQPPGGQTADIFGSRAEPSYSSASSQAGSDVASSRVHIETDQQSIGSSVHQMPVDGLMKQGQVTGSSNGQASPSGSLESASTAGRPTQQPLLMADDYKPTQLVAETMMQNQPMNIQQQKLIQMQQQEVNRSPKKTIPVIRRNPITGEIYENPSNRQPTVVRVRQPPGGRSSGIF